MSQKVKDESVLDYARRAMVRYSKAVNEDRAFPDFRDGLKPVQRRILYVVSQMPDNTLVKTARVVGDVLGKFHPHGDTSVSGAIETQMLSPTSPFIGQGNWGTVVDGAAHMRYTELRLSPYGKTFFDPHMMRITKMVPNYDDKDVEPMILPSLLPNLLLNGTYGIGLGMTSGVPSYTPNSVLDVCIALLSGEKLEPQDYANRLEFKFAFGGQFLRTKENKKALLEYYKTGRGTLKFKSVLEVDEKHMTVRWGDFAPGVSIEGMGRSRVGKDGKPRAPSGAVNKIKAIPGVTRVDNTTNKKGVSYTVYLDKKLSRSGTVPGHKSETTGKWIPAKQGGDTLEPVLKKIQDATMGSFTCINNVLERKWNAETEEIDTKFYFELTTHDLLVKWLKWRVRLELLSLERRIEDQNKAIASTKLFIYAVDHLDVIFKAIKTTDPAAYMIKHMKITLEQANEILERKVRQLSKLDQENLKIKLKDQQSHLAQLQAWHAKPVAKVKGDMLAMQKRLFEGNTASIS